MVLKNLNIAVESCTSTLIYKEHKSCAETFISSLTKSAYNKQD